VETDGGRLEAEQVLMAVGRGARTAGIRLEKIGVALERGYVKVSPTMETSVKGVYAIGDMAGAPLLAHKAMAEGVVAAEAIAGQHPRPIDYNNVPSCTYCRPQVASIGATEAKAKENGREVQVGKFPFTASGKAVALGETDGFVKVVADKATGEILGVHIVGPEATEIIHEFAVGRTLEATLEEIMHTIHAHPTLSEAALEATLAALGQAIHIERGVVHALRHSPVLAADRHAARGGGLRLHALRAAAALARHLGLRAPLLRDRAAADPAVLDLPVREECGDGRLRLPQRHGAGPARAAARRRAGLRGRHHLVGLGDLRRVRPGGGPARRTLSAGAGRRAGAVAEARRQSPPQHELQLRRRAPAGAPQVD